VIPRLRIRARHQVTATITIPEVSISKSQPFVARILQYADGRHVGGIQVVKRHPNWLPDPERKKFNLWVRTIDGTTRQGLPDMRIGLSDWDPKSKRFVEKSHWHTDKLGVVGYGDLPCSEKKLLTIRKSPWMTNVWRFRPLPGQSVHRTFKIWKLERSKMDYEWQAKDTLRHLAKLTISRSAEILKINTHK